MSDKTKNDVVDNIETSENVIKLPEEILDSIKKIQKDSQQILAEFSSLHKAKLDLERRERQIKDFYYELGDREKTIVDGIINEYGPGHLSLNEGTFTKDTKSTD